MNHVPDLGRFGGRQGADVLREPPELLVGQELLVDQIRERRHRGAIQARAQPVIDCLDAAPAAEPPVLMQVGREDREARVVLQRRRGGAVAPTLVAVAFAAADGIVELTALLEGRGAGPATRHTRELERHHVLTRVREERRERLEVRHHVAPLGVRQPAFPRRHRAAGEPLVDGAQQIGIRRQLAARRAANLVDGAREVAGPGQHRVGRGTVAGAIVSVTTRAPLDVHFLTGGRVLCGEGAGSGERYRPGSDEQRNAHQRSLNHGRSRFSPTSSASTPSGRRGTESPTRSPAP